MLSSIQFDPAGPSVAIGARLKLTITGIYSDGIRQDVSSICQCTSSNPDIASFDDATDVITALKSGTTTITSKEPSSGGTGKTIITVTDAKLQSLQVTPASPRIGVGASQQFTVTGIYSDNSRIDFTPLVQFTSSAANVATIDSKGLARGIDAGQATITALDPATSMSGTTVLIVGSNVQAPAITGVTPTSLKAGDECTITGSGFGTQDGKVARGSGMVYFGSYPSTHIKG
ncbi:MAG: Ig-like domain-containing protein [Candidatus Xenobiia bacterium LiM19]